MNAQEKPVLVEWQDSAQPLPDWRFLDDLPPLESVACKSVGWLVEHDENTLMLAPNIGGLGSDSAQGSGFLRIPRRAIIRVVELESFSVIAL